MSVRLDHVGAGCNRVLNSLHWGATPQSDEGLIAYASSRAVLLFEPRTSAHVATLIGHDDVVNCVHWFTAFEFGATPLDGAAPAAPCLLASGSGDSTVCVWTPQPTLLPYSEATSSPPRGWQLAARLSAHNAPVTSLTTHAAGNGGVLLVSTAGDGTVAVWEFDAAAAGAAAAAAGAGAAGQQAAWSLRQQIAMGAQLQGCAALAPLPDDPDWCAHHPVMHAGRINQLPWQAQRFAQSLACLCPVGIRPLFAQQPPLNPQTKSSCAGFCWPLGV
jgi:WD40 repeat protein